MLVQCAAAALPQKGGGMERGPWDHNTSSRVGIAETIAAAKKQKQKLVEVG